MVTTNFYLWKENKYFNALICNFLESAKFKLVFPIIDWFCLPGVKSLNLSQCYSYMYEPRVSHDIQFGKRVRCGYICNEHLCMRIQWGFFWKCIFNGYYSWSLSIPSTDEVLAINNVTWDVNGHCPICLISSYTYPLLN